MNYETQLVQRGDLYAKAGIKISDDALKKKLHRLYRTLFQTMQRLESL